MYYLHVKEVATGLDVTNIWQHRVFQWDVVWGRHIGRDYYWVGRFPEELLNKVLELLGTLDHKYWKLTTSN